MPPSQFKRHKSHIEALRCSVVLPAGVSDRIYILTGYKRRAVDELRVRHTIVPILMHDASIGAIGRQSVAE